MVTTLQTFIVFRTKYLFCFLCIPGVVHENPRIGSDGESEEISAGSVDADDAFSPVKLRVNRQRRFSEVSTSDLFVHAEQFRAVASFL